MNRASTGAHVVVGRLLRRFDVQLRRYSHSLPAKRKQLFEVHGVNLVLDVGANTGQYSHGLRSGGYRGKIVSFEPLQLAFANLQRRAQRDPLWDAMELALGEVDRIATMNIAGNSVSSSVLAMENRHVDAAPTSSYVGTCEVTMARLDSIAPSILADDARIHLKLDVQGYEFQVLQGAKSSLERITSVETEMSLVPLYQGQALMPAIIGHLQGEGFKLVWLERGFLDPRTGYMLQADGLFLRSDDPFDFSTER